MFGYGTEYEGLAFWLPVIGRLKPGVSLERAQTEMSGISDRIAEAFPNMKGFGAYLVPLHKQMVGDVERQAPDARRIGDPIDDVGDGPGQSPAYRCSRHGSPWL